MKLAKPRIDIGFATNNAPAALAFWQNGIGLPFDYTQPIRRGYKQHRHDLCGSILKINQLYEPLPDNPPSGYRELLIARDGIGAPQPMTDPDGNRVVLVPKGMHGSRQSILKNIGNALLVRHRVSGPVEVEEKPDVLWDKPHLERLYARLEDEYELKERAESLNRKLAVIAESAQVLTDIIDTRRSLRLEVIIVLLILFEVIITIYQLAVGRHV